MSTSRWSGGSDRTETAKPPIKASRPASIEVGRDPAERRFDDVHPPMGPNWSRGGQGVNVPAPGRRLRQAASAIATAASSADRGGASEHHLLADL